MCDRQPQNFLLHFSKSRDILICKTKTSDSTYSGSSKKSSYYDSYDDGYDDVYMDGDYDYDRYDRDPDYADGVDDALDEFDGDW